MIGALPASCAAPIWNGDLESLIGELRDELLERGIDTLLAAKVRVER